jgi:hypothetical protein
MKRKESIIITAVFALFLVGLLVLTLLSEKPDFSEWENRPLASFPEASADTVLSGEFGKDFELWLTDRFAARDFWVKFKRVSDSALGIREAGGVVIGNNALFDIPDPVNTKAVDKNISAINLFAEKNELPVSVMLVPSAATLFPDSAPSLFPSTDEESTVSDIYSRLDEGIETVDVIAPLRSMSYTDAFYKTDHHWTSKGAVTAYAEWIKNGNSYAAKTVADNFYGTLTSRSGDIFTQPDTIEKITSGDRFVSCEVFDGKTVSEYPSMYFEEYLAVKDKYSYFLGSNQPLVTLKTENATGRTLLMFKDSFAHSFVQCAAVDFDKVILVDLRYVTSPVNTLVDLSEVTDVLFLYSVENFTTQDNMMWIK